MTATAPSFGADETNAISMSVAFGVRLLPGPEMCWLRKSSGGHLHNLFEPSLAAKNAVLFGAKSVCEPTGRKDDIVVG